LQLAVEHGLKSIALPSISTGVYRFPIERASHIALREVTAFLKEHPHLQVRFACFSEQDRSIYQETLMAILQK